MANLSLKHIYKVYPNGTKAVNDFNMEIADREFIVFVGPSGCGKSTMLRMIAGLEDISAGELSIGDTVVNDMEPKDRDIAMVFQNYALYPHMTVYENIAFGLRVRKLPKEEIHSRVVHAAEILGIKDYLDKKPKEMSGGQRQRVSLGRAIVRDPKVMLLDEPLSNLDAKLRTQMRAEILKLHTQLKTTFIYVTHDQVEAMTMGTRIVVMKGGFVQQIDTPRNLYRYPANKFVAGFIGTPQMNFFDATLMQAGDKAVLSFAGGEAVLQLPMEYLRKVRPRYLCGGAVCAGIRAEDISLAPNVVAASPYKVKMQISHVEDLGDESLVYGTVGEARIIVKTTLSHEYRAGDVCEAAFNVKKMHFFDAETEETIAPRLPEVNELACSAHEGKLTLAGAEIALPPALQGAEGEGTLLLPTDAVGFGGDIPAVATDCEQVGEKYLIGLELGGARLFAVSARRIEAGAVKLAIDFKRVTLTVGEFRAEPLPDSIRLAGTFVKKKERRNASGEPSRKKMINFYLDLAGASFPAPENITRKLLSTLSPRAVFSAQFLFEFTPYALTFGEAGIAGEVLSVVDYGAEQFALVRVGEETVPVLCERPISGMVCLVPVLEQAGVCEAKSGIKLL